MRTSLFRFISSVRARSFAHQVFYQYILIAVLDLIIFIPQAKFDPDAHHDGIMFAAAVGAAEGKIPNRDVFAQYGPLAPIIHSQILKVFGNQLINLRLATALMLTLSAILLFSLLIKQIGFKLSFLIQLLWVLSYPKLPLPPLMPWASVICTLLILISLFCWKSGFSNSSLRALPKILFFISGLALSLAIFVRIQMLFFVLAICCLFLFQRLRMRKSQPDSGYFLVGTFVIILTFFGWIMMNGALQDFVEQCITWPREFYGLSYLPSTIFTKDGFIYWATWYYYPLFYFAFVYLLRNERFHSRFLLSHSRIKFAVIIGSAVVLALVLSLLSAADVKNKSYLNPLLQGQWIIEKTPLTFFYFLATLGFLKIISHVIFKRREYDFFEITLVFAAIAQLYPGSDPIHLWWIAPILIVTVLPKLVNGPIPTFTSRKKISVFLIFLILVSGFNLMEFYSKDRVAFPSNSVLAGMVAPADEEKFVGESLESIARLSFKDKFLFDCADGLYSVASGNYIAQDKFFVNWGPVPAIRPGRYSIIFTCRMSRDEIDSKYPSSKYEIVEKISSSSGKENYFLRVRETN